MSKNENHSVPEGTGAELGEMKIRFSDGNTRLKSRIRNNVGAILLTLGVGLSGSSIMYTTHNQQIDTPGDGIEPATTLLTHIAGIDKYETYRKTDYDTGDGMWEYEGTHATKDSSNQLTTLDSLLTFPGNFSIFIGGILLIAGGINSVTGKKKVLLDTIRKSLLAEEEIEIQSGTGKILLHLQKLSDNSTMVIYKGLLVNGKHIDGAETLTIGIDEAVSKLIQKMFLKSSKLKAI